MATYTPVPVDVRVHAAASADFAQSGSALDQGHCLYFDSVTDRYFLAQSDTQAHAKAVAFAITPTDGADEWFVLTRSGVIGLGVALPIGAPLIVSDTPGKLCDMGDAVAGWWVTIVGIPKAAQQLPISFMYSSVAKV